MIWGTTLLEESLGLVLSLFKYLSKMIALLQNNIFRVCLNLHSSQELVESVHKVSVKIPRVSRRNIIYNGWIFGKVWAPPEKVVSMRKILWEVSSRSCKPLEALESVKKYSNYQVPYFGVLKYMLRGFSRFVWLSSGSVDPLRESKGPSGKQLRNYEKLNTNDN